MIWSEHVCQPYIPPPDHPGNKTIGWPFKSVWLTCWGHCGGHDRARVRWAAGDHRYLVVTFHRIVMYIKLAPWRIP